MKKISLALLLSVALCVTAVSAQPVSIHVDAARPAGPLRPVWAFFGHDEPNYTYMKDGRKLLSELAAAQPVPVYMRVHSLLVTGDGKAALKWGSTNAYTEDASGKPVYDWTIVDRIFDTYNDIYTGWAYPPKDYGKWAELVYQWVRHSVQKYGRPEVETWLWEVWN